MNQRDGQVQSVVREVVLRIGAATNREQLSYSCCKLINSGYARWNSTNTHENWICSTGNKAGSILRGDVCIISNLQTNKKNTFLLELRTAMCHFAQRAGSCQKSLQNDTGEKKTEWTCGSATMPFWHLAIIVLLVWVTFVCALMNGNPTLHFRKSKSTSPQEIPFSSCRKIDREWEEAIKTDRLETQREIVTVMQDTKRKTKETGCRPG